MINSSILSQADALAIARATCSNREWQSLPISPIVRDLLTNANNGEGIAALEKLLSPEVWHQVIGVSPDDELPQQQVEDVYIPTLPEAAHLTDKALKLAEQSGQFVDRFLNWATKRTPMTPRSFLESGAVWAISLAIARRCHLSVYKPVYPNLYILWIAPTSIFKKTTGMEAIGDVVKQAFSHLLMPQEMTPEAFMLALAGRQPSNYEKLPTAQKNYIDLGRQFAGQRGIHLDEASSMLGANRKDYMHGQEELLLRGFDSSSQPYRRWTASEGLIEVQDLSLCILGATTPAALIRNITFDSWETGQMARYALLYPEQRPEYQLSDLNPEEYKPPVEVIAPLRTLYDKLPPPPDISALSNGEKPKREVLAALINQDAHEQYASYTKAVTHELLQDSLDQRLWPNYSRLHELTIKVALALACIEWADNGAKGTPRITLGTWARAQQIAETWRASLHRLIKSVDTGEDARTETRVLNHLTRYPEGETLRDLTNRTGLKRAAIQDALQSLTEAGLVVATTRKSSRGPEAVIYIAL